jgi:hypothetical protein
VKAAFLRLVGLSPTDVKQIEVFLRFARRGSDFLWISTSGDSCDLQLQPVPADGVIPSVPYSANCNFASRAWVLDDGQDAPDTKSYVLRRPLQFDGFEALLRTQELQLARIAVAPVPSSSLNHQGTARPMAPVPAARATPFVDDVRRTYRLARWPGSELLRGKPKYVRMLGFLSNRALSLARLKVLSGIDEASCRDLLGTLDERGLLIRGDVEPGSTSSVFADTVPSELAGAAVTVSAVRATASGGFLSRLRKRLGLTLES